MSVTKYIGRHCKLGRPMVDENCGITAYVGRVSLYQNDSWHYVISYYNFRNLRLPICYAVTTNVIKPINLKLVAKEHATEIKRIAESICLVPLDKPLPILSVILKNNGYVIHLGEDKFISILILGEYFNLSVFKSHELFNISVNLNKLILLTDETKKHEILSYFLNNTDNHARYDITSDEMANILMNMSELDFFGTMSLARYMIKKKYNL